MPPSKPQPMERPVEDRTTMIYRLTWKTPYKLPPRPRRSPMPFFLPLTAAEELQTRAVDHQMQRARRNHAVAAVAGQTAAAAAERRVIGDGELKPEQPQ